MSSNNYIAALNKNFDLLDKNTAEIKYDFQSDFEEFDQNETKAPKYLQSKSEYPVFKFLEATYIGFDNNTLLRTLTFRKTRFHAELVEGAVILNNLAESKSVTLQVGNALLKPFHNGVYYVAKKNGEIKIQVISGNLEVGIYDGKGELTPKI